MATDWDKIKDQGTNAVPRPTDTLTPETIQEAIKLIQALAPPKAPKAPVGSQLLRFSGGLNIVRNNMLPANTIAISEDLFSSVFAAIAAENADG